MNHESQTAIEPAADERASLRFQPGQIVSTPGALEAMQQHGVSPLLLLLRHLRCDHGEMPPEDVALNHAALEDGGRIFSSYEIAPGVKVWLITDACDEAGQRQCSTYLLPEEY